MAVITHDAASEAEAGSRDLASVLSSPWMLGVILVLAFVAYAPTLGHWFGGDDFWFLAGAQANGLGEYAQTSLDPRETQNDYEFNRYRPLYPIAWKMQFDMFGAHAFYYHAVVVGLHLSCVVLSWFVFRRLLGEGGLTNLATAIFALHPAYVDAVGLISGGNRVFAALPYIAAVLLFMKYRDGIRDGGSLHATGGGAASKGARHPGTIATGACYLGSLLLYVVAIGMHSSTVTLVLVLVAYSAFVAGQPRDAREWRWWIPFAPFAAVAGACALVQLYVRDHTGADAFFFGFHMFANYGWYFGMMLVPVETIVSSGRLQSFAEDVQLIASCALIAVALAIVFRRPMWGLGVFAVSWFVLALIPDSTFILGWQGRLLYVPGFAGALLLVAAMLYLRDMLPADLRTRAAPIAPWVAAAGVVVAALFTMARADNLLGTSELYENYAAALREDGPEVREGGTLYLMRSGPAGVSSPDSHFITLAQVVYGDNINVVVVRPNEPAPALQPGDGVFAP